MKIVIVGHVDHGKSTLIGRLLLDTHSLSKEKLAEIKKVSKDLGRETELAFLTDQLKEERERNITMDTSEIQFKTKKRPYVIIDAPGHVEFLKNMLSGATHADAAVLVIDALEGLKEQSMRHSYLIHFIGVRRIIVLINKMDAVGYSEEKFQALKNEFLKFSKDLKFDIEAVIPASAKLGENISRTSAMMKWYKGRTFLEVLDRWKDANDAVSLPLRFPVQDNYKKVTVGKVVSGVLKENQELVVCPSGQKAVVQTIKGLRGALSKANADENVGLTFKGNISLKRGDVLCAKEALPKSSKIFRARLFWLADAPLKKGDSYTLRCSTQEAKITVTALENRMNSSTLEIIEKSASVLQANEAAEAEFSSDKELVLERFDLIEELGRFVIDKDYDTLGFGLVA